MKLPINGGDNQNYSDKQNAQKTINWYPEIDETGKGKMVLQPTPGSALLKKPSGGAAEVRFITKYDNAGSYNIFALVGNTLYRADSRTDLTSTWTSLGTVPGGPAATNQAEHVTAEEYIVFRVGSKIRFCYDKTSGGIGTMQQESSGTNTSITVNRLVDSGATFQTDGVVPGCIVRNTTDGTDAIVNTVVSETQLTLSANIFPTPSGDSYTVGDYPTGNNSASCLEYMDGYTLVGTLGANRVYVSAFQNPVKWSALDFQEVGDSDNWISGLKRVGRYLWVIGTRETEVWYNSGNADFPFERVPNVSIQYGANQVSTNSLVRLGESLLWVGLDETGPVILQTEGLKVNKVSDLAMDLRLRNSTDDNIDPFYATGLNWNGHYWYVLTFVTDDETWVYDLTTKSWFQWSTGASGAKHFARCMFYDSATNKHLAGHVTDGGIYELDKDTYQDDSTAIVRTRQSAILNAEHRTLFQKSVEIVVDSGASAAGTQELDIKWSKDGGDTWSSTYTIDATAAQPTIYVADAGRSFLYHITTNDDYGPTIIDAYANFKAGRGEN